MTLALPNPTAGTPIFADMLADLDELDVHFLTAPVDLGDLGDDLDAHFASIVLDTTTTAVVDAELVAVVDATPTTEPTADDDIVPAESIRFDTAMWILAAGTTLGGIAWLYVASGTV